MPKARTGKEHIPQAPLTAEALIEQLRHKKSLADIRGLKPETEHVVYAQALAKLQQKDHARALYLFSFLVLHQHLNAAYWQGLGYAQAGLGNHAAAAMSFLASYAQTPNAAIALELAKSFNDCGMAELATQYAEMAHTLAKKSGEQQLASQATLLEACLREATS